VAYGKTKLHAETEMFYANS